VKFVETAHVKDLLAHLRVVANPLDTVSWHRVLMLVEGVGPKRARDLLTTLVRSEKPYHTLREVSGRSGQGLKNLANALEGLSGLGRLGTADQVSHIYEYYLPILKEHYDDYPKRIRDLDHLLTIAEGYAEVDNFLSDLALDPPDGSALDVEAPSRDDERMVLSTIHSAKGLEWQCVFVIWVVDGKFPSTYSFVADEDLEEERRLFYVAVTRAKRHLYLTYPINVFDKSSGMLLSKPTRFLDHVSPTMFEQLALIEEGSRSDWDRYRDDS
jgi:DNA helicase-2/ATP-dependent DNA helicase PcrA